MPVMSAIERAFCHSTPWRAFAQRAVLPWALNGHALTGDVLEIGGGSGAMAAGVARTHPDARLVVTDLDPAMVAAARQRLEGFTHVRVQTADVTALPFADHSFDVVTSYLMLHHVVDWPGALTEAARVLRPGGLFIGYDMTDTALAQLIHRVDRSPYRMVAPQELAGALVRHRFTGVTVTTSFRHHVMRFGGQAPIVA